MAKQEKWYVATVAVLLASIVLVAVSGLIYLRTRVIKSQDIPNNGFISLHDKTLASFFLVTMLDDDLLGYVSIQREVPSGLEGVTLLINALLNSSTNTEESMFSLVPENVKLRSIYVQEEIVFIDFSENFQFNPWGRHGYEAQLQQVLRTIASISSADYVQILIEGKRVDFLHEGVYIGQPLDIKVYKE